jgi:hypothetical protein
MVEINVQQPRVPYKMQNGMKRNRGLAPGQVNIPPPPLPIFVFPYVSPSLLVTLLIGLSLRSRLSERQHALFLPRGCCPTTHLECSFSMLRICFFLCEVANQSKDERVGGSFESTCRMALRTHRPAGRVKLTPAGRLTA